MLDIATPGYNMADPRKVEKEYEANDPIVGANTTAQDEPPASPGDIKGFEAGPMAEFKKDDANSSGQISRSPSKLSEVVIEQPHAKAEQQPPKQKSSRRINPLKRNPPPVPEERGVAREYGAGWFSL